MDDFASCFTTADAVYLSDIYAAHEQPIEGIDAAALAARIRSHGPHEAQAVGSLDAATSRTLEVARPGDVILTLGAGSVAKTGEALVSALSNRKADA
jgi:UDP-N-acetylmuramate--alanine ligase